jgi:hypothetical protein
VSEPASGRIVAAYLAAMVCVSAASIAALYGLFVSGFPEFLSRLAESPVTAVQNDPVSPALALTSTLLAVVLVGLVVAFGARHGPAATGERSRRSDEE